MTNPKKIFFIVNVDWFFISHRFELAKALIDKDYEVFVLAKGTSNNIIHFQKFGIKFIDLNFHRSKINFFSDFISLVKLYYLIIKHKPGIIHAITIKPILFISILSRIIFFEIKYVCALSGLGFIFTNNRISKYKIFKYIFHYSLNNRKLNFIFQNIFDKDLFLQMNYINCNSKIYLIKGSGVNLKDFESINFPNSKEITFLFASRLLYDKGIQELKTATQQLKVKYKNKIKFIICGDIDKLNKSSVDIEFMNDWVDDEYVTWKGYVNQMLPIYNDVHISILPSYREGTPKFLIESTAAGKPIITTNVPGCSNCVIENYNGFLIEPYSSSAISNAIEFFLNNSNKISEFGKNSRKFAIENFSIEEVISKHLEIYNN